MTEKETRTLLRRVSYRRHRYVLKLNRLLNYPYTNAPRIEGLERAVGQLDKEIAALYAALGVKVMR